MNPGDLIGGKYRLIRQIGQGAMGVVWSAVNELTTREVALKLILRPRDDLRRRLLREARACGTLSHRHIIEVYDVGQTDSGDPFLVMQLLSGETLAELLARQRRLDPPFAMQIGRDVARALDAAHAASIVHRDLKPANIFLHREAGTEGIIVKVLDFGVSKNLSAADDMSTAAGEAVGSPAYMSPEQIRADRTIDHRTDIWSLGVILFEMLTGVRPFKGTGQELIQNILTAEVPPVSKLVRFVDPAWVALIFHCLERDRDQRIASAADIAQALQTQTGLSRVDMPAGPQAQAAGILDPKSQGVAGPLVIRDAGGSGPRGSSPAIARGMPMPATPTQKLSPAPAQRVERTADAGEYTPSGTLKWSGPAAEAMGAALRARLTGSTTSTAALVKSSGAGATAQRGAPQSGASSGGRWRARTLWGIAGISVPIVVAGGIYALLSPTATPPAAQAAAKPPEAATAPSAGVMADGSHLVAPTPATSSDAAIPSAGTVNRSSGTRAPVDNTFYDEMDGDGIYDGLDRKTRSGDGVYE